MAGQAVAAVCKHGVQHYCLHAAAIIGAQLNRCSMDTKVVDDRGGQVAALRQGGQLWAAAHAHTGFKNNIFERRCHLSGQLIKFLWHKVKDVCWAVLALMETFGVGMASQGVQGGGSGFFSHFGRGLAWRVLLGFRAPLASATQKRTLPSVVGGRRLTAGKSMPSNCCQVLGWGLVAALCVTLRHRP